MAVIQTASLTGQGRGTTNAISFSVLPQPQHAVMFGLLATANYDGTTITGVADNQGNVYSKVVSATSGSGSFGEGEIWTCASIGTPTGTFTVTATNGASNGEPCMLFLLEEDTNRLVDQTGVQSDVAAAAAGTVTASAPNTNAAALVLAAVAIVSYNGPGWSVSDHASSGYTSLVADRSDNGRDFEVSYKEVSASETSAASWTWSGTSQWFAVLATFKSGAPPLPIGPPAFRAQIIKAVDLN